jgi:hypothetical protein
MCEMMFCGVQTGVIPMFVPFAHLFAAVLTAALTGSMYYVISSPKGKVSQVESGLSMIGPLGFNYSYTIRV